MSTLLTQTQSDHGSDTKHSLTCQRSDSESVRHHETESTSETREHHRARFRSRRRCFEVSTNPLVSQVGWNHIWPDIHLPRNELRSLGPCCSGHTPHPRLTAPFANCTSAAPQTSQSVQVERVGAGLPARVARPQPQPGCLVRRSIILPV